MSAKRILAVPCLIVLIAMGLLGPEIFAQQQVGGSQREQKSTSRGNQDLVREIGELRDRAAELEARVRELGWIAPKMGGMAGMKAMSGGPKMGGMDKSKSKMAKMGAMAKMAAKDKAGSMGKMGMSMGMKKMGAMSGMGQSDAMETPAPEGALATLVEASAEPGLPGVSHALHVGATGFFIDHARHLQLSPEQVKRLAQIQQSSFLADSTYERQIAEAEQVLWSLTGESSPSLEKITQQVNVIAGLGAEQRVSFVRGVMEALALLTPEQNKLLLGDTLPEPDAAAVMDQE